MEDLDLPVFRATKRRRLAKPTKTSTEDASPNSQSQTFNKTDQHHESQSDDGQYSTVIRASRKPRATRTGVNFSTGSRRLEADEGEEAPLVLRAEPKEDHNAMSSRFVGAGGQIIQIDKNMVDYIDARIKPESQANATEQGSTTLNQLQVDPSEKSQSHAVRETQSEYQLAEVHLPISSHRYVKQREGASTNDPSVTKSTRRPRKPRLGRNGKPLRPRHRQRRASEDIARDALVEQVLHESKLDAVYMTEGSESEDEEAAVDGDEAFAERFKQGFMDQVAERQAQQQQKTKPPVQTREGPKLGGSRTARAKMQALQEAAGPEKK